MPSFIFWPSSLAAPLNGAEMPNRISLSVTPCTELSVGFGSDGRAIRGSCVGCACMLLGCCASGVAAIRVTLSAGSLSTAMGPESLNDGASEPVSRCAFKLCQSGFANMIRIAVHAAAIPSQLIHVGTENPWRCICGWKTGPGSYSCRPASFSKKEGTPNFPPACEGGIGGELERSRDTAGLPGCSRNFLGAYA